MISHGSGDKMQCTAAHAANAEGFEISIRNRIGSGK